MPGLIIVSITLVIAILTTQLENWMEDKRFPLLRTNEYCLSIASKSPLASTKMIDSCRDDQQVYIEKSEKLFEALSINERRVFKSIVKRKNPMDSKEAYEILKRSVYENIDDKDGTSQVISD